MVNTYLGFVQAVLLAVLLLVISSSNASCVLLCLKLGRTHPVIAVTIAIAAAVVAVAAGLAGKSCEAVKSDSVEFLHEYEQSIALSWRRRGFRVRHWMFKRRPVAVGIGSLMKIEEGFAKACMLQALDQTVNLIFMADISVPLWLLPSYE